MKGMQELAAGYASKVRIPTIILLSGSLGAGKTTFVRFFCKALDVKDRVNSPSFNLVNRYRTGVRIKEDMAPLYIYHLDLYRLKLSSSPRLEELLQIDDSHFLCLIEWADIFEIDYKKWAREQGADLLKLNLRLADDRSVRLIEEARDF